MILSLKENDGVISAVLFFVYTMHIMHLCTLFMHKPIPIHIGENVNSDPNPNIPVPLIGTGVNFSETPV